MKKVFAAAVAGVVLMGAGQALAADGKAVYDKACFACHKMGIAGSPKFGDKALWAPRIAQGMDVLNEHALKGFKGKTGMMPPKGGRTDLSDEEVIAAVEYMDNAAK